MVDDNHIKKLEDENLRLNEELGGLKEKYKSHVTGLVIVLVVFIISWIWVYIASN